MKFSSGILVISVISIIEVSADAAESNLGVVLDQLHSILRDQTETVDLMLALSVRAFDPMPVKNYVKLIRIVNMALLNYMRKLFEIARDADLVSEPYFSQNKLNEVAQMCNHSAALMTYFLKMKDRSYDDLGREHFGKPLQLMPVGPLRKLSIMSPDTSKYAIEDEPESQNSNLEELLSNVESIITSKQRIFNIIQTFLLDLRREHFLKGIMIENVDEMHKTLFDLMFYLKVIARGVPNLVVEDVHVKESKKLSSLALSILSAMISLD